jgi:hypothetical protein
MNVAAPIAASMVSGSIGLCHQQNFEPGTETVCFAHVLQSSSASRITAGAAGFLNFSQSGDRPER